MNRTYHKQKGNLKRSETHWIVEEESRVSNMHDITKIFIHQWRVEKYFFKFCWCGFYSFFTGKIHNFIPRHFSIFITKSMIKIFDKSYYLGFS